MTDAPRDHASQPYPYITRLEVLHGPLEVIDVGAIAAACTDRWFNQTLCRVNDSVVRVGLIEGEYHWHHHDDLDEFFHVVSGRLLIDLEDDRTVELRPQQGFEVAAAVRGGRLGILFALALVACFAAPGAAEPQVSCEGSFGFLAGDDVDIGPVFSLRVLHIFSPMLHGGVEAASGIAQKLELPYALPTQGPSLARQTERFQYLDVVVVVRSARGPYAILGAGVYDRVTYAQSYGFQGVVIHEAAPGGSAGLGFSKGRRISPFVEFRMHAHGRIGGETWSRPGSSVDFLWTGAGGLAFQF